MTVKRKKKKKNCRETWQTSLLRWGCRQPSHGNGDSSVEAAPSSTISLHDNIPLQQLLVTMEVSWMDYKLWLHSKILRLSRLGTQWQLMESGDFSHPVGSRLCIFGAMPGFGGLVLLIFALYNADILGRRMGTAIGCLSIIVGSLIQSFQCVKEILNLLELLMSCMSWVWVEYKL